MARGLFRDESWAQVDYDGTSDAPMSRNDYEARGYQPPFDELPLRQAYEAARDRTCPECGIQISTDLNGLAIPSHLLETCCKHRDEPICRNVARVLDGVRDAMIRR